MKSNLFSNRKRLLIALVIVGGLSMTTKSWGDSVDSTRDSVWLKQNELNSTFGGYQMAYCLMSGCNGKEIFLLDELEKRVFNEYSSKSSFAHEINSWALAQEVELGAPFNQDSKNLIWNNIYASYNSTGVKKNIGPIDDITNTPYEYLYQRYLARARAFEISNRTIYNGKDEFGNPFITEADEQVIKKIERDKEILKYLASKIDPNKKISGCYLVVKKSIKYEGEGGIILPMKTSVLSKHLRKL